MFIDEINEKDCWRLWVKIHNNPVKIARQLFPDRPKNYVKVTNLIGSYSSNKGTALGLAAKLKDAAKGDRDFLKRRIKVYVDIAAEIYIDIPAWGRSFSIDFLSK